MRRRSVIGPVGRRLFAVLAIPLLLASLLAPAVGADELSDARERQRQLHAAIVEQREALAELRQAESEVRAALRGTGERLQEITADQATAREQLAQVREALEKVEARLRRLVGKLRHLDWTLDILQREQVQSQQDLEQRRRLLGQRLDEAYRTQQTGLLQQVFSADSFISVVNDVSAFLSFGDQDAELAAQIERDQELLDALDRTISVTRYRTDQVRLEVRQEQVRIREQRNRLEALEARLARLARKTELIQARQEQQYEALHENAQEAAAILRRQRAAEQQLLAQIERLIEEQRQQGGSGGQTPPPTGSGHLSWPMRGYISQEFGCTGFSWEPPLGSCAHFHRGIDIVAPYGTPVGAAGPGKVMFTGFNPYDNPSDPAWIVIIDHGGGLVTWYAHLIPRTASGAGAGSYVDTGDTIGWEGNTGHSTGAHLHWATASYGNWVNPRLYL
ncbi:MAG TPA: peptidoglycan DD-metalloendopeptidase family protein [Candidatus Limnocylindrales bacterium]|jgi:murein DD-endopeptidase MepM/ murein hydrolase activator NlpD|nr:peptidoglycan DD-metalloendopeptidase family protein [Candidatus Limnocylindrales bacterium]